MQFEWTGTLNRNVLLEICAFNQTFLLILYFFFDSFINVYTRLKYKTFLLNIGKYKKPERPNDIL